MWVAQQSSENHGKVIRYSLATSEGIAMSYASVLNLWKADLRFRHFFNTLLASSSFNAFLWETPPITIDTLAQPFEFVLIDSPSFFRRPADPMTFRSYFVTESSGDGIVTFPSLYNDSTLIVPVPRGPVNAYGHLAAFIRQAPESQVDALWRVVSVAVASMIAHTPLWLSTAGGGVAWLHVRLDTRPKYYMFNSYRDRA